MKLDSENKTIYIDVKDFGILFSLLEYHIDNIKEELDPWPELKEFELLKSGLDNVYWKGWGLEYRKHMI